MPPSVAASPETQAAPLDRPWAWLAAGWRDFQRAQPYSLAYGLAFVGVGVAITAGLWFAGLSAWIPVAAGGFALLGPLLATGLYEMSRRLDAGEPLSWGAVLRPRIAGANGLAMLGLALCLLFLIWFRAAELIVAVFLQGHYPPLSEFATYLLTSPDGLALLVFGTAVGGVLAFAVFAISAIAAPMLVERDLDVVTAMIASVGMVRRRPGMMLLWAWIVAVLVAVGFATALVGLAVVFPVLGHAAWRAYRALYPPAS